MIFPPQSGMNMQFPTVLVQTLGYQTHADTIIQIDSNKGNTCEQERSGVKDNRSCGGKI